MNTEPTPLGRPLDPEVGAALKQAALSLVRENGYEKVSIASIVATAGVARQSLYNRWNGKAELVLAAMFDDTSPNIAEPLAATGKSHQTQLEDILIRIFDHLAVDGDTIHAFIAAAQSDTSFRDTFRSQFVDPLEENVVALLRLAQQEKELPPDRSPEMLSSFVHGAFWYRMLMGKSLTHTLARDIAAEIFKT